VLAALLRTRLQQPAKNALPVTSLQQIRQRAPNVLQVALPALMLHHATPALLLVFGLELMPANLSYVLHQVVHKASMLTRRHHHLANNVVLFISNAPDVQILQFALDVLITGNLEQALHHVSLAPAINSSTRQIAGVWTSFLAALAGTITELTSVLLAPQPTAPNAATRQEFALNANLCLH
jgi:hypothetical protein